MGGFSGLPEEIEGEVRCWTGDRTPLDRFSEESGVLIS